jgi:hypothetical protein
MQRRKLCVSLCPILIVVGLVAPTNAVLLSYEPFADAGYTVGTQLPSTTTTVTGYTGPWIGTDWGTQRPAVQANSLEYTGDGYLGSTGNKVGVPSNTGGDAPQGSSGRVYRMLDSSLTVTSTTTGTLYLSFLFQRGTGTGSNVYQTLALGNNSSFDSGRHFDIGVNASTQYNFGVNNTTNLAINNQTYHSTGVTADTGVHLFVVKFTLSASDLSDSVTVWVDPVLGGIGDPAGGTTVSGRNLTWDRIALSDYDDNAASWDEIRWGTTFDSVTIIPEPASLALFALGMGMIIARHRRTPRG